MIRIISLFLITLVLLQSCTTISYKQDDWASDKTRGLHIYENIRKDESYSFWSYLTWTGVPLAAFGGGGQAYYEIATKNGTPADSARDIRNIIWAAGLVGAGFAVYHLIQQDSTLPKGQSIYGASNIEEWFVSEFDTDDYILLGFNGSTAYVLESDKENTFGARSNSELEGIYSAMKNYVVDKNLLNKIAKNSVNTIPKSEHFDAYNTLDRKYPIFLKESVDYISDIEELYRFADEVEALDDKKVKSELRSKTAKRIYERIQESYSYNMVYYNQWLDHYSRFEGEEILSLRSEIIKKYHEIALSKLEILAIQLKNLDEELEGEIKKVKSNLTYYKNDIDLEVSKTLKIMDNLIKHPQNKALGEQLESNIKTLVNNLLLKLKSSEEMKSNVYDLFAKIEHFNIDKENINYSDSELLTSKRNDLKEELLKIKRKNNQAKREVDTEAQDFNVFVAEIQNKLNSKLEELKKAGELQKDQLKEQVRKEQKALIAELEPGDCVQYRYMTEKSEFLHTLAQAVTAFGLGDVWQTVQIIKIKNNIITVKYMKNTEDHYAGQEAFLSISENVFRKCK